MSPSPEEAGFLPLAQLSMLVARLMELGYRCLGPAAENGAIVMRELAAPDALPRGLQAASSCCCMRHSSITTQRPIITNASQWSFMLAGREWARQQTCFAPGFLHTL